MAERSSFRCLGLVEKSQLPLVQVYEGVAEGLKGIYKKKLLPLERESRSPSDDNDQDIVMMIILMMMQVP